MKSIHKPLYNTALKTQERDAELRPLLTRTEYAKTARGIVFAHDICAPLPARYERLIRERAACIYSEPAWKQGWVKFHLRAGLGGYGSYDDYLYVIKALVAHFAKPSFLVLSPGAAKVLGEPTQPIKLNGSDACLLILGSDEPIAAATTEELLDELGRRFPSVWDFSCGYGRALRAFDFFIGSDIDRKCLNYIEREILHGRGRQPAGDGRDRADPAVSPEPAAQ